MLKNEVNRVRLVLLVCVFALVSGCATFQKMEPVDQAATLGIQLSQYYESLYQQAVYINDEGTADQKEFMRTKVNPIMNKTKDALIMYQMGVLTWKTSGTEPDNMAAREKAVKDLLDQAAKMIVDIIGEG